MGNVRRFVLGLAAFACVLGMTATGTDAVPPVPLRVKEQTAGQLRENLARVNTTADSIAILYNIFDLTSNGNRLASIKELYNVASRAGNESVKLDMLRNWADLGDATGNEALGLEALKLVMQLPESEDRKQTETFIRASIATSSRPATELELTTRTMSALREIYENPPGQNVYNDVARLFAVVHLLSGQAQGTVIGKYLEILEKSILKLPPTDNAALKNKFYTMASRTYWQNEEPNKCLYTLRKLLDIINRKQREYEARGRVFKTLDTDRYMAMRRMLKVYPKLTVDQVDSINSAMQAMALTNPNLYEDYYHTSPVGLAVGYIKHGDYSAALPLVNRLANDAVDIFNRRYYLRLLRDVASRAGNDSLKRQADYAYITSLEEFIKYKSGARAREIRLVYDATTMRRDAAYKAFRRQQRISLYLTITATALLIIVIPLIILYVRSRKKLKRLKRDNSRLHTDCEELAEANKKLTSERDRHRDAEESKTRLINYLGYETLMPLNAIVEYSRMIVDNTNDHNKEYMRRFCSVVESNSRMLQDIAANVHEYAMLTSPKISANISPVDPNRLGAAVVDNIKPQLNPGVEIAFVPDTSVNHIHTDRRRVELALMALLSNAAKFTSKGKITLTCKVSDNGRSLTYTVTDSGTGVPAEMSRKIFEIYERLDPESHGTGLGLSICRLVARLLHGYVKLDTSFRGPGARFIFTIPTNSLDT